MLRDTQARLSAILEQLPVAVGLCDMQGRILLSNRKLRNHVGGVLPSHDPAFSERWRAFTADGRPLDRLDYPGARALRGEIVVPGVDLVHIDEQGGTTWLRMSAAPLRDEAGEIVGALLMLQDVDDEKRTLQRLIESEGRLQAAADLVQLGLYSWNPRTNELQWDQTVKAIWGLPADAQVDYATWRSAVHPEDLERVEEAVRSSVDPAGDGIYNAEYRVIGIADGEERWVATRGRAVFEGGEATSFYGVAIDITDRKRIETDLQLRVEARTLELEDVNRHLRSQIEQREIAEAAVLQLQRLDAIGQITSSVAHDFNILLTNARLLALKPHDPDDQDGIDLILGAAERGAKLTAQLLAFSRKQGLDQQAIDLNSRIEEMTDLIAVTLGDAVHLKLALDPRLWPALIDPTQIELIIINLTINARDAMPTGGTLTLHTFNTAIGIGPVRPEEPPPGEYIALAVSDTGVGISTEVLPRVFEPFFTTKAQGKGSGLGLTQVFGVAKQSGGGVKIETQLGVGTSVTIFLPRAERVEGSVGVAQIEIGQAAKSAHQYTILVVDDDADVLKSTLRILNFLGYVAVSAHSGAAALFLLKSHPEISLVLADYAMPDMGGVELADAIEAECPELPVVLVTGDGDLKVLERFGQSRVLNKPYTENDLLRMIKATLG